MHFYYICWMISVALKILMCQYYIRLGINIISSHSWLMCIKNLKWNKMKNEFCFAKLSTSLARAPMVRSIIIFKVDHIYCLLPWSWNFSCSVHCVFNVSQMIWKCISKILSWNKHTKEITDEFFQSPRWEF